MLEDDGNEMDWKDQFILIDENVAVDANDESDDVHNGNYRCRCRFQSSTWNSSNQDQLSLCLDKSCINYSTMMECVNCSEHCQNNRIRKNKSAPLDVKKTGMKGHGLFTINKLKAKQYITEYLGELISEKEMTKRMKLSQSSTHLFMMQLKDDTFLDATMKGSISRFINHSCEPNCVTEVWTVGNRLRVGIFASCDIPAGGELTFDYQWSISSNRNPTKCFCGTPSCRGYIEVLTEEQKALLTQDDLNGTWRYRFDGLTTSQTGSMDQSSSHSGSTDTNQKLIPNLIIGKKVKIFWDGNQTFFIADVMEYSESLDRYRCQYLFDKQTTEENLNDPNLQWYWLDQAQSESTIRKKTSDVMEEDVEMVTDTSKTTELDPKGTSHSNEPMVHKKEKLLDILSLIQKREVVALSIDTASCVLHDAFVTMDTMQKATTPSHPRTPSVAKLSNPTMSHDKTDSNRNHLWSSKATHSNANHPPMMEKTLADVITTFINFWQYFRKFATRNSNLNVVLLSQKEMEDLYSSQVLFPMTHLINEDFKPHLKLLESVKVRITLVGEQEEITKIQKKLLKSQQKEEQRQTYLTQSLVQDFQSKQSRVMVYDWRVIIKTSAINAWSLRQGHGSSAMIGKDLLPTLLLQSNESDVKGLLTSPKPSNLYQSRLASNSLHLDFAVTSDRSYFNWLLYNQDTNSLSTNHPTLQLFLKSDSQNWNDKINLKMLHHMYRLGRRLYQPSSSSPTLISVLNPNQLFISIILLTRYQRLIQSQDTMEQTIIIAALALLSIKSYTGLTNLKLKLIKRIVLMAYCEVFNRDEKHVGDSTDSFLSKVFERELKIYFDLFYDVFIPNVYPIIHSQWKRYCRQYTSSFHTMSIGLDQLLEDITRYYEEGQLLSIIFYIQTSTVSATFPVEVMAICGLIISMILNAVGGKDTKVGTSIGTHEMKIDGQVEESSLETIRFFLKFIHSTWHPFYEDILWLIVEASKLFTTTTPTLSDNILMDVPSVRMMVQFYESHSKQTYTTTIPGQYIFSTISSVMQKLSLTDSNTSNPLSVISSSPQNMSVKSRESTPSTSRSGQASTTSMKSNPTPKPNSGYKTRAACLQYLDCNEDLSSILTSNLKLHLNIHGVVELKSDSHSSEEENLYHGLGYFIPIEIRSEGDQVTNLPMCPISFRPWISIRQYQKDMKKSDMKEYSTNLPLSAIQELILFQRIHYHFDGKLASALSSPSNRKDDVLPGASQYSCPYFIEPLGLLSLPSEQLKVVILNEKSSRSQGKSSHSDKLDSKSTADPTVHVNGSSGDSFKFDGNFNKILIRSKWLSDSDETADTSIPQDFLLTPLSDLASKYIAFPPVLMKLDAFISLHQSLLSHPTAVSQTAQPSMSVATAYPFLAIDLCSDLLSAVDHLISCGIYLRWLATENIYITVSGHIKIGDLSGASMQDTLIERRDIQTTKALRNLESKSSQQISNVPRSYLHFVAPEVLLGDVASVASSIYSIGCICAHILLGAPLIKNGHSEEKQLQLLFTTLGTPKAMKYKEFHSLPFASLYPHTITKQDEEGNVKTYECKSIVYKILEAKQNSQVIKRYFNHFHFIQPENSNKKREREEGSDRDATIVKEGEDRSVRMKPNDSHSASKPTDPPPVATVAVAVGGEGSWMDMIQNIIHLDPSKRVSPHIILSYPIFRYLSYRSQYVQSTPSNGHPSKSISSEEIHHHNRIHSELNNILNQNDLEIVEEMQHLGGIGSKEIIVINRLITKSRKKLIELIQYQKNVITNGKVHKKSSSNEVLLQRYMNEWFQMLSYYEV